MTHELEAGSPRVIDVVPFALWLIEITATERGDGVDVIVGAGDEADHQHTPAKVIDAA